MVENSHLYQGPLFSALGRFIQDGCVLQCVAYQRKPVPDYQHRVPSLGNCLDDLSFHFHEQPVDGLNPSAPNWVSVQDLTTSSMAPKLKQAVWCMSKIVLSNQRAELEGGFFTCLQQKRDLCSLQNGEQLPVYSVRPTAPDAVVLPHHNIQFILGLNRDSFLKIVGIYREEFRLRMCNLMEDWLVVFVALLDHFSQPSKQCVLNAYWEYFIALAEIEEQAALYAGVLSYEDMLYTQMKRSGQKAANEMFRSLQQHMDFPLRFPMRIETENTRIFGDMMSRWAIGAYAMPAHTYHRYQDYFYPSIARERKRLTQTLKSVETITGRIVPANIPGYTAPDIVRQVWSYHSEPHSRPFSLFI
ncbi:hypothetical protein B0H14DRAFT_825480 [Mycena olivaceomarginata]|nr:hypothetical protein B0H14DRAFT_825480 [Mycena olivaceomarginata]